MNNLYNRRYCYILYGDIMDEENHQKKEIIGIYSYFNSAEVAKSHIEDKMKDRCDPKIPL